MLRESISVGHYAMVNATTGQPFPDFFSTLLWREVVGNRVLRPMNDGNRVDNRGKDLRIYSRCARLSVGEVVVVLVNLSPTEASLVAITGVKPGSLQKEWILEAGTGTEVWSWGSSKRIALNGATLDLSESGDAPQMTPKQHVAGREISIPPLSVALIQYEPAAKAVACISS